MTTGVKLNSETQGALFIMRHFPFEGSTADSKHADKMSKQLRAYWGQIGANPEVAVCSREDRSRKTAIALGFSEDKIKILHGCSEKTPISLEDLMNEYGGNIGDKNSAVYIGHLPQLALLWENLNRRRVSPLSVDHSETEVPLLMAGEDATKWIKRIERLRSKDVYDMRLFEIQDMVKTIQLSNAYLFTSGKVVERHGAVFWAGHGKNSLAEAFAEKAFVSGETFVPGYCLSRGFAPGLAGLVERVLDLKNRVLGDKESKEKSKEELRVIDRQFI